MNFYQQLNVLENDLHVKKRTLAMLSQKVQADQGTNKLMLENRVLLMEKEIEHLNQQVIILKNALNMPVSAQPVQAPSKPSLEESQTEPVHIPVSPVISESATVSETQVRQVKPVKKDLEKTIGTSVTGIFATVLIFISIVLFATLVLPLLGDAIKQICIYTLSFGFIALGLIRNHKNPTNLFNHAIVGCGLGGVYISLLLSNMYFNSINDIVLFIGIFIWAISICFFIKIKSTVFEIIGWLGILVAVILGCVLCSTTTDVFRFTFLIIFYILTSIIFFFANYKKNSQNTLGYTMIFMPLIFLTVTATNYGTVFLFSLAVFDVLCVVYSHAFNTLNENGNVGFSILAAAQGIYLYAITNAILDNSDWGMPIALIVLLLLWGATEFKLWNSRTDAKLLFQIPFLIIVFISVFGIPLLEDYLFLAPFVIAAFAVGFLFDRADFRVFGFILLGIHLFGYNTNIAIHLGLGIFIFLLLGIAAIYYNEQKQSTNLFVGYLMFILFLAIDFNYYLNDEEIVVLIISVVNAIVCSKFVPKPAKSFSSLCNVINLINMICILPVISSGEGIMHFIAIAVGIAIYMINTKSLLENSKSTMSGIYVGSKITLLMLVILDSFDSVNYVISIACLILAISCILIGFMRNYKSLRIYGLILIFISVIKLVMIDITYDNSMGHAFSFFIAGILVFVVNLIYNYIDKRISEDN